MTEKVSPALRTTPPQPSSAVKELVLARIFDAPRALVFKAWTDPKHLAQWWGPKGFTNPVCEWDARPGGTIHVDMTGPDGVVYPMGGVFHEIVEPERLVFTTTALADEEGNFRLEVLNTVTFAEHEGKTKLTLRAVVVKATAEAARALAGMEEGWSQTLDKLSEYVAKDAATTQEFVVTRTFDVPRDLVFQAWTESERLARWWGPKGITILVSKLDLRPGGMFHYAMRSPDGREMWGKFAYREIVLPERIVFVMTFSDETGNVIRAPFSPTWPMEVLSTVTFTEHEGRTTLTLRGVPLNATEAERKTFETGHESMQKGWTGTLDQLTDYLAKV